jgi:uncharacterized protein
LKLQPDRPDASLNMIAAFGPRGLNVNGQIMQSSVVLPWTGALVPWECNSVEQLTAAHFEMIAALRPEVVLIGTGTRLRFARPEVLRPLIERRIGHETMDTAAACRTYNILVSEGRSVVAALLLALPDAG